MAKRKKRSSTTRPRGADTQRTGVPTLPQRASSAAQQVDGERRSRRGVIAAAILFLVLVVAGAAIQYQRTRALPETPRLRSEPVAAKGITANYVGGKTCAECHAKEAEAWRGSDHDLAMQTVDEKTVLGDFRDAKFKYAG